MIKKQKIEEDNDPFDIWMNLGLVIGGRTRHLELLLAQIKNNKDLKLVYTKTSGSRLKIQEETGEEYYKK